jgi:hypothetical protein
MDGQKDWALQLKWNHEWMIHGPFWIKRIYFWCRCSVRALSFLMRCPLRRRVREPVAASILGRLCWQLVIKEQNKTNSVVCSPRANYTDRATAACRRS